MCTEESAVLAQLADVLEEVADAVIITARDGGIAAWNRAAERLLGATIAGQAGQCLSQLLPGESRAEFLGRLQSAARSKRVFA